MPQIRAVLRGWTDDEPPPVRTQLLVLRSLDRLKNKARAKPSFADALARAMRVWRPPPKPKPSPAAALIDAGLLTGSKLAKALGMSDDQVLRLRKQGVLHGRACGRRAFFSLDEARIAIAAHVATVELNRGKTRRRAAELICCKCQQLLPRDRFIPTVEHCKRRGKVYIYKTVSSDCRECRKKERRELRRRKAEAAGKMFTPRGDRAAWEADRRAARVKAKADRRAAWAVCLAFRALVALSPEERRQKANRRIVRRQKERYHTDPVYYAQVLAKKLRRKRAMKGTQVVPVNRELVAERDGWCCAICRGKVTRANWSLDHVTPLSKGGSHTYENVVLAHRACNVKRGAGRFPVQAPLFALPPGRTPVPAKVL